MKRFFTNEEMAVALELFTEGCSWKIIERYLGHGIYQHVRDAKRHGIKR